MNKHDSSNVAAKSTSSRRQPQRQIQSPRTSDTTGTSPHIHHALSDQSKSLTPSHIMQLQRAVGNQSTLQLIESRQATLHNKATGDHIAQAKLDPSQPIQRTVIKEIGKENMTPRQLGFKFFGKYVGKIKESLDQLENAEFDTVTDFLNKAVQLNPEIADLVDKNFVHRLKLDLMVEKAKEAPPVKKAPTIKLGALVHSYDRHTFSGIKSAGKILSSTLGDRISVFPEAFGKSDLENLATTLEQTELTWKSRGGGQFEAVSGGIKLIAQLIGEEMNVDSFFPINNSISREEAEKLISSK